MARLELFFASKEDLLSVRRFSIREALSCGFEITAVALSPNEDLDLDALLGKPAGLRVGGGPSERVRHLRGVCVGIEQLHREETGLSTYEIRIEPRLALLGHRTNYRIFQHKSAPEIAEEILADWGIEAAFDLDRKTYPKLEYRVQYGESDLAFLLRTLEEAGVSFSLPTEEPKGPELVFEDAPQAKKPAHAVPYLESAEAAAGPFVTAVRVSRELRPGRVVVRDFDFRLRADYKLYGDVATKTDDDRLERYAYEPGSSLAEEAEGDRPAEARPDPRIIRARAERVLAAERVRRRQVSFETNVLGLRPGATFTVEGHPRAELGASRLLVTELWTRGEHDQKWTVFGRAVFADLPYRPLARTPKPRVQGLQSAIVVGPAGEEIHTDAFGRVRVQFHWDRRGDFDDGSSCWLRVSQAWAGGGFGALMIPRVGQEVLVGFLEGDPDQPIVVGRVYNNTSRVPYPLPEAKTVSGWRSDSSPGSGGFNELRFDDQKGRELVFVQAERDLVKLVKNSESVSVGEARLSEVGRTDDVRAGERHSVTIAAAGGEGRTRLEMTEGKIVLTTGDASVVLEGDRVTIDAAASITVTGRADVRVEAGASLRVESAGGEVVIQGGPMVRINPAQAGALGAGPAIEALPLPAGLSAEAFDEGLEAIAMKGWYDPENPSFFDEATSAGGELDPTARGDGTDEFRAFRYAAAGRAMGYPEGVLLRQAGLRQEAAGGRRPERGDPGNGVWGGKAPFGNDPKQAEAMKKGFEYHGARQG